VIRIVTDTNVLVSALIFGGNPRKIMGKALARSVDLVLSRQILEELEGVLCERKFKYPAEVASSIIQEIESISEIVAPSRRIDIVQADPYDNMILECAGAGRVDYIVSGGFRLLDLREFEGIKIVTVVQLLEIMERR